MKALKSYRIQKVKSIVEKKKKHVRVKGYWKRYHGATSNDVAEYELCRSVCKENGNPWNWGSRGPKPKAAPWEYAAIHAYRRYKGLAYRGTEQTSVKMFGFFVDHSWIGKTLKRISPVYFKQAVQTLAGRIKALLVKHTKTAHIVDSTGITTDRKVLSKKGRLYFYFMKLHIIICYWIELGILCIETCLASGNNMHDGTGMRRMLPDVQGEDDFFGDKGYSGPKNRKAVRQRGFTPQIKPKSEQTKKEAKKYPFNLELYKYIRGRIECVFGGTTTKHDNKTRCRLEETRLNDTTLYALNQDIQAYKQAITIKITILIRRQPPFREEKAFLPSWRPEPSLFKYLSHACRAYARIKLYFSKVFEAHTFFCFMQGDILFLGVGGNH